MTKFEQLFASAGLDFLPLSNGGVNDDGSYFATYNLSSVAVGAAFFSFSNQVFTPTRKIVFLSALATGWTRAPGPGAVRNPTCIYVQISGQLLSSGQLPINLGAITGDLSGSTLSQSSGFGATFYPGSQPVPMKYTLFPGILQQMTLQYFDTLALNDTVNVDLQLTWKM